MLKKSNGCVFTKMDMFSDNNDLGSTVSFVCQHRGDCEKPFHRMKFHQTNGRQMKTSPRAIRLTVEMSFDQMLFDAMTLPPFPRPPSSMLTSGSVLSALW